MPKHEISNVRTWGMGTIEKKSPTRRKFWNIKKSE